MADDASSTPQTNQPGLQGFGEAATGPWALEETLKKVLSALQKDINNNVRQNRNFDILNRNIDRLSNIISDNNDNTQEYQRKETTGSARSQKVLDDIKKSSTRAAKAQEEANRSDKPSKNSARDNLLNGGGGGGRGGGFFGIVKDAAMKTGRGVLDAGKAIIDSGGDIAAATEGVARAIPGIGAILASSSRMVNEARDQFATVAKTGQTFNGRLTDIANAAAQFGLSTKQVVSILSDNSEIAAKIGGTNFLRLQREVRSTTEKFGRFGLTVEDQAKVVGIFSEMQLMRGNREQANSAKAAAEYTAKMAALAKLTGKSIDDLAKTQQDLSIDADVYTAVQKMADRFGPAAAESTQRLIDNIIPQFDEKTQGTMKDLVTSFANTGSISQSELGQALIRGNREDLIPVLEKSLKSGNEGQLLSTLRSIGQEGMAVNSTLRRQTSNVNFGYGDQGNVIAAFGSFAKISDAQVKGLDAATAGLKASMTPANPNDPNSVAGFDQNQTVVQEQLSAAYAATLQNATNLQPALQQLTVAAAEMTAAFMGSDLVRDSISQFSAAVVDATQNMSSFIASLQAFDALEGAIGSVISAVMKFGDWLGKVTGIGSGAGQLAAGAGAWFGGKWLLGKAGDGVKSLFGGGKGAAGAAESGAARGAAGLGAGAMRSLARGGLIGAGLEGLGYLLPGGKEFTLKNGLRSALRVGGGALGGLGGGALGTLVAPGAGTTVGGIAGGMAGYAGGNWLAEKLLGPDDLRKIAPPAPPKQPTAAKQQPKPVVIPRVRATTPGGITPEHREFAAKQADLKRRQDAYIASIKAKVDAQANANTVQPVPATQPTQAHYAAMAAAASKGLTPAQREEMARQHKTHMASFTKPIDKKSAKDARVAFPTGDEMQNRQLQEMQMTNKILMGIYDNGQPKLKPKPAVVMYNGGW